jgi:hypothetical protein
LNLVTSILCRRPITRSARMHGFTRDQLREVQIGFAATTSQLLLEWGRLTTLATSTTKLLTAALDFAAIRLSAAIEQVALMLSEPESMPDNTPIVRPSRCCAHARRSSSCFVGRCAVAAPLAVEAGLRGRDVRPARAWRSSMIRRTEIKPSDPS